MMNEEAVNASIKLHRFFFIPNDFLVLFLVALK